MSDNNNKRKSDFACPSPKRIKLVEEDEDEEVCPEGHVRSDLLDLAMLLKERDSKWPASWDVSVLAQTDFVLERIDKKSTLGDILSLLERLTDREEQSDENPLTDELPLMCKDEDTQLGDGYVENDDQDAIDTLLTAMAVQLKKYFATYDDN